MKKKGNSLILFSLFFIASIIAEIYCMLEFTEDYFTILGVGVVVLIASYLMLDGIRIEQNRKYEEAEEKRNQEYRNICRILEEIRKFQKDTYKAIKPDTRETNSGNINELMEHLTKLAKIIIKYNKNDMKVILNNQKEIGRKTLYQMEKESAYLSKMAEKSNSNETSTQMKQIENNIITLENGIKELNKTIQNISIQGKLEISNQKENTQEKKIEKKVTQPKKKEKVVSEQKKTVSESKEVKLQSNIALDGDPNRQLTPDEISAMFNSATTNNEVASTKELEVAKEEVPNIALDGDPNRQLTPDEIAAMFNSVTTNNEVVSTKELETTKEETPNITLDGDPSRQLTPDEIAAMFNSVTANNEVASTKELENTKEEAPNITLDGDPNKQMSSDEIAALFASMNK